MLNPKVSHAIKDVAIVIVGVFAVWMGLRVAFATDNPFYVVSSGSMEPVLNVYDVLIVKDGSTFEKVKRGDIIVFNRPEIHDRVIVHRVVNIKESSERVLTTKSDANPASIPGTDYPITKNDYIGEVVYVIPKVGYVTRLINPPVNYIIIAIILAILFFNKLSRSKKSVPKSETEEFLTYENRTYGIKIHYPVNWEVIKDPSSFPFPLPNFVVAFLSPTKDNIVIANGNLPADITTLDEYTDASINEIKRNAADFKLIESSQSTLAGNPAHKIVFTYANVKQMEVWTIKDNKQYMIAYGSNSMDYSAYLPTAQKMIDSFEIESAGTDRPASDENVSPSGPV